MNKLSNRQIVRAIVTRRFEASPEDVYDSWLHRERLGRWMFGPAVRDEEIVHLSLAPRIGGAFSFLVERDGEAVDHLGKYLELSRPHRLAFTWIVTNESVGSRIQVDIKAAGEGCELTLTQDLHPSFGEAVIEIEDSWRERFDQLAVIVE